MKRANCERHPMPPRIKQTVIQMAGDMGYDPADIVSTSRAKPLFIARSKIMKHLRDEIVLADGSRPTLALIGRWFGRDHSSVHHAIEKARAL